MSGFCFLCVSRCSLHAVRRGQTQDSWRGTSLRKLFDERDKEAVSRQKFWIWLLFSSLLLGFLPLAWPYLALHDSWELWKQPMEPGKFLLLFGVMPIFLLLVILSLFASLIRACGVERISQLFSRRFVIVLGWTILALAVLWAVMAKWSLAECITKVD